MENQSEIISLQQRYRSLYKSLRRNGRKNKMMMILLMIPAAVYCYLYVNNKTKGGYNDLPHEYLYYVSIGVSLVFTLLLIAMNSISFVNEQRLARFKLQFKTDLYDAIRNNNPVFSDFNYFSKINPEIFNDSGLFSSTFSDYAGDDWFYCEYNGAGFEICELHVFNFLKKIFDGLFIRIDNPKGLKTEPLKGKIHPGIRRIEQAFHVKIKISVKKHICIAIERNQQFFEDNNPGEIRQLPEQLDLLHELVVLSKEIIDYSHLSVTDKV